MLRALTLLVPISCAVLLILLAVGAPAPAVRAAVGRTAERDPHLVEARSPGVPTFAIAIF